MGKTVKWILGILGVLVVLLVILTLSLPFFIDPNDYKDTITAKVREQTGRELSIPGDIKLDVSLIGLKTVFSMGEVRLSSSEKFPDTTFFASRHAEISLALWPLITSRELKVNTVRLENVDLNLVRNSEGESNWEDLAGGGVEPAAEAPSPAPAERKGAGLAGIDIGGVVIKNINASLVDHQAGRTVKMNNFNLELGHVREGKPFPLDAGLNLYYDDEQQPPLTAGVQTEAVLTMSVARQHFVLEGLSLDAQLKGGPVPSGQLALEVDGDVEIDLPAEKVAVKKLTISKGDLLMEIALTMNGFAEPRISGSLTIPDFSPRDQAQEFGTALPLEDPDSLASMSAEMEFTYDPSALDISDLLVRLDDTTMKGNLSAALADKPAYDVTLHVNQLDLDRYKMKKPDSPPPAEKPAMEQAPETGPVKTAGEEAPLLPVDLLRDLIFTADITIDSLKAAKLQTANVRVEASGRDGLLKLDPLAADLYQGTLTVTGNIDARPEVPRMKLDKKLHNVQLGPLFVDLAGKEEVKGRADITADIMTEGLTQKELTRNSNGTIELSLADGEIAKLKIIDTIRTARALLETGGQKKTAETDQQAGTVEGGGRPTTFATLSATGILTDGVIRNNDLLAQSELMKVEGKGTVNLNTEEIDYLLTIYLARKLDRDEETGAVDLTDTPIPYRVRGTFDNISQSAALEEILKSQAKKTLFKEIEKQLGGDQEQKETGGDKPSGDPKDMLQKGLEGLFGR